MESKRIVAILITLSAISLATGCEYHTSIAKPPLPEEQETVTQAIEPEKEVETVANHLTPVQKYFLNDKIEAVNFPSHVEEENALEAPDTADSGCHYLDGHITAVCSAIPNVAAVVRCRLECSDSSWCQKPESGEIVECPVVFSDRSLDAIAERLYLSR